MPARTRLLYGRHETAELLSMSLRKLDQLLASGELRTVRIDRRPRVQHDELIRFIAKRAETAGTR